MASSSALARLVRTPPRRPDALNPAPAWPGVAAGSVPGQTEQTTLHEGLSLSPRRLAGPLLALLAVTAVAVRQLGTNATVPAPSTATEAILSVNGYALPHNLDLRTAGSVSETVTSWQNSAYSFLTLASDRHASLVGSTREFVLVTAVLSAMLMVTVCRRLRMGWLSAALAVALAGVPAVVALLRIASPPATVAAFWLALAGLAAVVAADRPDRRLIDRRDHPHAVLPPRRWPLIALSAVAAVIAIFSAGVSALLLLGLLLGVVATRQLGRAWGNARRRLLALGLLALLVLASWITVWGPLSAREDLPPVGPTGLLVALGGLAVAAACWPISWLRPVAFGAVPILVVAGWPGPAQAPSVIVALTIGAVLAAGLLDHLLRIRLRSAVLLVAAEILLVAVTVGAFVLPVPSTAAATALPDAEVAAWIKTQLASDAIVDVDPLSRAQLVRDGVDPARLTAAGQDERVAGFILAPLDKASELPLIAAFGAPPSGLGLRLVVSDPGAYADALAEDEAARIRFGRALAGNSSLALEAPADAALRAGDVDPRLMVVLAGAASTTSFDIAAFGGTAADPEDGTILREVTLTDIASIEPGGSDAAALRGLTRYFEMQQPPYEPLVVDEAITRLTVRYPAPSPLGLLP